VVVDGEAHLLPRRSMGFWEPGATTFSTVTFRVSFNQIGTDSPDTKRLPDMVTSDKSKKRVRSRSSGPFSIRLLKLLS
jgi:hypothetical protein